MGLKARLVRKLSTVLASFFLTHLHCLTISQVNFKIKFYVF